MELVVLDLVEVRVMEALVVSVREINVSTEKKKNNLNIKTKSSPQESFLFAKEELILLI